MGSAKNTGSASRKARIEEMRRAEQSRERRNRILVIVASAVVVVGLVVGRCRPRPVAVRQGRHGERLQGGARGSFTTGSDGVKTWSAKLSQTHVTKNVDYPMEPPVGGDHNRSG